ncbi:MAG: VWA domain-containing protein [Planctomycetaceae bacterium]|nr:VWA domain-containing protein [Planctomycetaceae bacterium]
MSVEQLSQERKRIRDQLKDLSKVVGHEKSVRLSSTPQTTFERAIGINQPTTGPVTRFSTLGRGKNPDGFFNPNGKTKPIDPTRVFSFYIQPGRGQAKGNPTDPQQITALWRARFARRAIGGAVAGQPIGGEAKGESLEELKVANEQYIPIIENEFLTPVNDPLSTFSIDVDTASYSNVRRFLKQNQWPPANAVRIEEMVNYFHYEYPEPVDGRPFSVNLEAGPCPWNSDHRLVRVGLKGKEIDKSQRPPSNLVFLLDVSGSMRDANKLPLVKTAMEMLVGEMTEDDRIAIVTYAGKAGLQLESTSGQDKTRIIDSIHALRAGGSTNGEAGIKLAYEQAVGHFIDDGANRVILCTDGDFNVGTSENKDLITLIQDKAKSKVFLSVFGFGMGNLKDGKLEQIADKGNGQYGYIDDEKEAQKVFVEEMAGTLYTIAKDVKIQVEFNPQQVGGYRLIGYENRMLAAPDFNDDTKDAGEIGAGHTVTALYEIVPFDKLPAPNSVDKLKYQKPVKPVDGDKVAKELLTLKLRYKQPDAEESVKIDFTLTDNKPRTEMPSVDFEWAVSCAGFGLLLRNSQYRGEADFDLVRELALGSRGDDESGRRREFLDLVYTARAMQARALGKPIPPRESLPEDKARELAAVKGKYSELLKKIEVQTDAETYGAFADFGYWAGNAWAGHENLPKGHWVYVAPHWYIWGETSAKDAATSEKE